MEFDAFSSSSNQDLEECGNCGRRFNADALTRHAPICAKSTSKKRKVFNSFKQRAEGSDLPNPKGRGKLYQPPKPEPVAKKSTWRQKHEDFINAIRSARGVQKAIESGGPLPPPPPPSINPDYVPCDYCGRRFNQKAAERHMPFCKEQHERLPMQKKVSSQAQSRMEARAYKPPRPKAKSSPTSNVSSPASRGGFGNSTNPGTRTAGGRAATQKSQVSPGNRAGGGMSKTQDTQYGNESPVSGRALRTGRTTETYTEARELSAKQRAGMPRKSPSAPEYLSNKYSSSRYNGGYSTPSPPTSARYGGRSHGDGGYFTNSDSDSHRGSGGSSPNKRIGSGTARFCHECGTKYPVPHAKFCCECGIRRISIQ